MSSFTTNAVCTQRGLCSRELMAETVRVMNQALHKQSGQKNSNSSSRTSLAEKISNGRTLQVRVINAQDMAEKEKVAIKFDEERIKLLPVHSNVKTESSATVCEEHLLDVAKNPETYLDNPMRLELVWVKERMTETEA